MKISTGILSVVLTALLGLEAWTLSAVVELKVQVGQLNVKVETLSTRKTVSTQTNLPPGWLTIKAHARGTNEP